MPLPAVRPKTEDEARELVTAYTHGSKHAAWASVGEEAWAAMTWFEKLDSVRAQAVAAREEPHESEVAMPAPKPWEALLPQHSPLREALARALPAAPSPFLRPSRFAAPPPQPDQVLDLTGLVATLGDMEAVAATLRAQVPLRTTTLSLKGCPALADEVAVKVLAELLGEPREERPPPSPASLAQPGSQSCGTFAPAADACVEVLYLGGSLQKDRHLRLLQAAWRRAGWLHQYSGSAEPLPELVPGLPVTLRRKARCYRPPSTEARLELMPAWAREGAAAKPKKAK